MSAAAEGASLGGPAGRADATAVAAGAAAPAAAGPARASGSRAWVARVLPFSAVDGPGNRAVVFLQGCDFDCAYCHNPETRARLDAAPPGGDRPAAAPSEGGAWPRFMTVPEVMAEFARFSPFLRGITVSGGECLLEGEFLAELLEASNAAGLPGLVDTNGSTPLEGLPRVLAAAEGFMLDLKAWDPEEHRALVGAENAAVVANLRLLAERGALTELRTVVIPGAFDAEGTVREGARILGASGSKARYRLIAYRPHGVRPSRQAGLREPEPAYMARLARLALAEGAAEVFVS